MTKSKSVGAPIETTVRLSRATYGGDSHRNATVTVRQYVWRYTDFEQEYEEAKSKLEELLIGQVATRELRLNSTDEPILEKGDKLTRLHFQFILDRIDWNNPSAVEWLGNCEWGETIRNVINDSNRRFMARAAKKGDTEVSIVFEFPEGKETMARISMSTSVANWLSDALRTATESGAETLAVEVHNGTVVVQQAKK